ncbi:major facilitator superfamily domain-containing protein [Obelidium mucronatum]|nr:major facilitator superfamily domain-containing protein [Obelidium mucronatum]
MIATVKRWTTAVSSCLSMVTAGSLFSFSVLVEGLKTQLSYTSSDLNTISGIGSSSLYISFLFIGPLFDWLGAQWTMFFGVIFSGLGYLLMYLSYTGRISGATGAMATFYFMAGAGSTCCYMGTIGQNVKNFTSRSAGKIVGVLLLFYGLSGMIYSQMYSAFYSNDTGGYLLFLTLSVAIVNGICCVTTFDVPPDAGKVATEDDVPEPHSLLKKSAAGSLESLGSIPEVLMVHHTIKRNSASMGSNSLARSLSIRNASTGKRMANANMTPRDSNLMKAKQEKHDIVVISTQSIHKEEEYHENSLSKEAQTALEDDGGVRDLSPLEILKSTTFWLYALTFIFMQGMTYFTNLFSILEAALGQTVVEASLANVIYKNTIHVTILSVFQSLGRISFSLLLDFMACSEKVKVDRSILLCISQVFVFLPCLVLACGATSEAALYFCSVFFGYGFGCTGACFPALTKDFFGTHFYGTACGFVMAGVPIGIVTSNLVFGSLYDSQSNGATICYGEACYSKAYAAFSGIECIALICSFLLFLLRFSSAPVKPPTNQILSNFKITAYGYDDNDDGNGHYGNSVIAHPFVHTHATEDLGTFDRPSTFAADESVFTPGDKIYIPHLRKYFIYEDGCAQCASDIKQGISHVDLYIGEDKLQGSPLIACEEAITILSGGTVVLNPSADWPVNSPQLFVNGICNSQTFPIPTGPPSGSSVTTTQKASTSATTTTTTAKASTTTTTSVSKTSTKTPSTTTTTTTTKKPTTTTKTPTTTTTTTTSKTVQPTSTAAGGAPSGACPTFNAIQCYNHQQYLCYAWTTNGYTWGPWVGFAC